MISASAVSNAADPTGAAAGRLRLGLEVPRPAGRRCPWMITEGSVPCRRCQEPCDEPSASHLGARLWQTVVNGLLVATMAGLGRLLISIADLLDVPL
jgi:hypothetical protein